MTRDAGLPNGVRVPRWLVAVVVATVAVATAGWGVGRAVQARDGRLEALELKQQLNAVLIERKADLADLRVFDVRLCRIERALRIEPWETCR